MTPPRAAASPIPPGQAPGRQPIARRSTSARPQAQHPSTADPTQPHSTTEPDSGCRCPNAARFAEMRRLATPARRTCEAAASSLPIFFIILGGQPVLPNPVCCTAITLLVPPPAHLFRRRHSTFFRVNSPIARPRYIKHRPRQHRGRTIIRTTAAKLARGSVHSTLSSRPRRWAKGAGPGRRVRNT